MKAHTAKLVWFAVQTRTRFERNVKDQLENKGIEHFLPLFTVKHRWSDRYKQVEQVLFPNYLFVRISESVETRIAVLRTVGVTSFVGIRGMGIPIPDSEIQAVQALLDHQVPFQLHSFLNIGQMVRVRGGCLDGMEGILTAINGNESLVISVRLIQKSVALQIRGFHVEPVRAAGTHKQQAEISFCNS
jgi:transcription antitermination factor NusG